ncbi:unnamed protein product [Heligmosomoides polygyrus]|uniref:Mitochondrial uncoupling protein 4 n=1 Tax=Heligmosomoides polygyrus TaxID=6339 RepID=A0A183G7S1_HELPZ|nr:unnamed protein product [Heligmosomoides polygyrus]
MADQPNDQDVSDSPVKQIITKYFLSCTAALVAESVTYPLDITKTRLQIARNKHTKGGVGPAITRHYIYTGIRMGAYESLRGMVFDKKKEKTFPMWKSMLCGASAGLVAQFAASPTDLVKMEGLRKLQQLPLRYSGAWHCFSSLYRTQGFFGLWLGWIPNCQRAALLNMADIATYDFVKHKLLDSFNLRDNWVTHALASACAGLSAAVVSLPSDVVKTRMMDQIRHEANVRSKHVQLYNGCIDCFVKIIRQEGFFSLYKGFLPSYIRMAPWSLTFWVSYEEIRKFVGAPSF